MAAQENLSVCVCDYESFRSVQVLCISLGLGEQTDTDTPVAQKSALLSKPNDVKNAVCECMFVYLQAIQKFSARNGGKAHKYKYTHKYACKHLDTEGKLIHTKCTVCRRKIWLHRDQRKHLLC